MTTQHYTLISQDNIQNDFERLATKNGLTMHLDGFGGAGFGNEHDMFTFTEYPGIIINALYELDEFGGTIIRVDLQDPNDEDEYFEIFRSKSALPVFNFLKKRAGNYEDLIRKEEKRKAKEREAEYQQYLKENRRRY